MATWGNEGQKVSIAKGYPIHKESFGGNGQVNDILTIIVSHV